MGGEFRFTEDMNKPNSGLALLSEPQEAKLDTRFSFSPEMNAPPKPGSGASTSTAPVTSDDIIHGHIVETVQPWLDDYADKFKMSGRDAIKNAMWTLGIVGAMKTEDLRDQYSDSADDIKTQQSIKAFDNKTEAYALHNILSPAHAIGDIAGSTHQMAASFSGMATGSVVGGGIGATIGGAPGAVIGSHLGSFGGGTVTNMFFFSGALYKQAIENGVDEDTAKRTAIVGGAAQAMASTVGDVILKGVATKRAAKIFARSPQGKLMLKETAKNMLKQTGMLAAVAGAEGGTEVLEQIAEFVVRSVNVWLSATKPEDGYMPSFQDWLEGVGQSFVGGFRGGLAQGGIAASLRRVIPKQWAEIFDDHDRSIEDLARKKAQERADKIAKEQEEAAKLRGEADFTKKPLDALKDAEYRTVDLEIEIETYEMAGEEVPQELKDKLKKAENDVTEERRRVRNFMASEKEKKLRNAKNALEDLAKDPNITAEHRAAVLDKALVVGKTLREIQGKISLGKAKRRIKAIDKEIVQQHTAIEESMAKRTEEIDAKVEEKLNELQLATKVRIRNLSLDMLKLKDEILARKQSGKPTKQLEGQLAKLEHEREYIDRAFNKHGNITKVAPKNIRKLHGELMALKAEKENIEAEDTPAHSKLKADLDALNEERAYFDLLQEMIEHGQMTSADYDSLNEKISNTSGKRLANIAAKMTLQAYAQAKSEDRSLRKMRKVWERFIDLQPLSQVDKNKLPSALDITFKNLQENLDELSKRAAVLKGSADMKAAEDRLEKALERGRARRDRVRKVDKSKFDPETDDQQIINLFDTLIKDPNAQIKPPIGDEDLYAAVQSLVKQFKLDNADSVNALAGIVEGIVDHGLQSWKNADAQRKAMTAVEAETLFGAIQGKDPVANLDQDSPDVAKYTEEKKKQNSKRNSLMSWSSLMHKLTQDTNLEGRVPIVEKLDVADTVTKEDKMFRVQIQKATQHMQKAAGINGWTLLNLMIKSNSKKTKDLIEFTYTGADGTQRTGALSPGAATQAYLYTLNPALDKGLQEGNNFTTDRNELKEGQINTRQALEEALNDADKNYVKTAKGIMKYYDESFDALADEFQKAFGVTLDKEEFYAGYVMRVNANPDEDIAAGFTAELRSYATAKASSTRAVMPGTLIARQENSEKAIRFPNAYNNLISKIRMDTHWIAWRETSNYLNRLLNHPQIKELRAAKFTKEFNNAVDQHLKDLTQGIVARKEAWQDIVATFMTNQAIQLLGGWKPQQFSKQLTGLAIVMNEVGLRPFLAFLDDFFNDPINNARAIRETEWYKNRTDNESATLQGQIQDATVDAMARGKLHDFLLGFVGLGDKAVAIIGGHILQKHYQEQGFHYNLALKKAGNFVEDTQSSRRPDKQSQFQRSPTWRWLSLFMQQLNALYEIQHLALMEAENHPSIENYTRAFRVGTTLRLAQVLFSAAGNVQKLTGDDEDERDQALWDIFTEAVNGPLPGIWAELKAIEAQIAIALIDADKLHFNKPDAWEFKTVPGRAISSLHKLFPTTVKAIGEDDPNMKTKAAIDALLFLNASILAFSKRFGFIPAGPTGKDIKKFIDEHANKEQE